MADEITKVDHHDWSIIEDLMGDGGDIAFDDVAVDFRTAISAPTSIDHANRDLQGHPAVKSVSRMMFTNNDNAVWHAKELLREGSYPAADVSFPANRNLFRLEPGDRFVLKYDQYGIDEMVCRVVRLEEKNLESEEIIVHAVEETTKTSQIETTQGSVPGVDGSGTTGSTNIEPPYSANLAALDYVNIVEAPYPAVGGSIWLIPMAAKKSNDMVGFVVMMSVDGGTSYNILETNGRFLPYGTLVANYSDDTYMVDDSDDGFEVDFVSVPASTDSITRTRLFGKINLAILGSEIVSFQNITPVTTSRYRMTGIVRGRWDTERTSHVAGEDFWIVGSVPTVVQDPDIVKGATLYFKMIPFSENNTGKVADATATSLTITGRALTPYKPINLKANDSGIRPTYTGDIVLTWSARVRGEGAGTVSFNNVLTDTDNIEGYFKVEVWVSGAKVRTADGISTNTWTYTSAMNTSDNGSLASQVTFKLSNYRTENGVTYTSAQAEIVVNKE
jgi:hypothetical protein